MVRHAFRVLTQDKVKTQLLCFSDDMDGMRKIPGQRAGPRRARAASAQAADVGPESVRRRLRELRRPQQRDAAPLPRHVRLRLRIRQRDGILQGRAASTRCCCAPPNAYDDIMAVMLPTLGPERQATYSPFLPISPKSGRVLYVPMKHVDAKAGTITFDDENGTETTLSGHRRQCEAAVEAGFRHALGGARRRFRDVRQGPPDQCSRLRPHLRHSGRPRRPSISSMNCSSTSGQKISKSKGNGLTIDEWLTYAPTESLGALHVPEAETRPRSSISMSFPRRWTNIYTFLAAYPSARIWKERLGNPVWHMHDGNPPICGYAGTVLAAVESGQRLQR